jgi:hypothetical protein
MTTLAREGPGLPAVPAEARQTSGWDGRRRIVAERPSVGPEASDPSGREGRERNALRSDALAGARTGRIRGFRRNWTFVREVDFL